MIVITGAAGFIGSCMTARLNEENFRDLVLVDDFSRTDKLANHEQKAVRERVPRAHLMEWLKGKERQIQCLIHLGARTDTTEKDELIFDQLNLKYSQQLWKVCAQYQIPFIYASSAATYGGGERGFDDDPGQMDQLQPLNPYGKSKHLFDLWARKQNDAPYFWAGLKFFNVYGPNEYHKGRMASVIFHAYHQVQQSGKLRLFRSHREDFADGEQQRDFIYVKDIADVIFFLMNERKKPGIYNLGTGQARTFNDLGKSVFDSMKISPNIEYIDTPIDIRDAYQYFTEARMGRLREIGYTRPFTSLEEGTDDYVTNYLKSGKYW